MKKINLRINLTDKQKQWLAWMVTAVVISAISTFLGIEYAMPPAPVFDGDEIVTLGTTHFTNISAEDVTATDDLVVTDDATVGGDLAVSGTTSWGCSATTIEDDLIVTGTLTAEDATITDTLNVDGDIDLDGDGFDVNITAGASIDADAASNINVAGAGVTLTLESEAGTIVVKGDEGVADAIHLDANDAVTTGIDIDVGSVSGLTIDGGLVDIGGGTCGVADGDNDVCIKGVLEVDDELELDGALDADSTANIAGLLTLQAGMTLSDGDAVIADDIRTTAQTALTVTNGAAFTPTGTYQNITAAGEVTPTITIATAGDLLVLINTSAQTVNLADSGTAKLSAAWAGAQYDVLILWCDGTNWIEISRSDN